MTQYFPGPYEVELQYVAAGITHKQRLNATMVVEGDVGDPFSSYSVLTRAGGSVALNTAVDAWVTLIKTQFANTINFTTATLYKYVTGTNEKNFRSTYNVAQVGTGSGSVASHQDIYTFITQAGNGMRISLLETQRNSEARIPIDDGTASEKAIANFLIGTTNWIKARDGSFPIGKLNLSGGQNEALFKRRNR